MVARTCSEVCRLCVFVVVVLGLACCIDFVVKSTDIRYSVEYKQGYTDGLEGTEETYTDCMNYQTSYKHIYGLPGPWSFYNQTEEFKLYCYSIGYEYGYENKVNYDLFKLSESQIRK